MESSDTTQANSNWTYAEPPTIDFHDDYGHFADMYYTADPGNGLPSDSCLNIFDMPLDLNFFPKPDEGSGLRMDLAPIVAQEPLHDSNQTYEPLASNTSTQSFTKRYMCLSPSCPKGFNRSSDLDRHYKHVHGTSSEKELFTCDYKRCPRAESPSCSFGRKDHFRDHLRDFHREDLPRKGGQSTRTQSADWMASRQVDPRWWRCAKCLRRISIARNGWECPDCKVLCEEERRMIRTATAAASRDELTVDIQPAGTLLVGQPAAGTPDSASISQLSAKTDTIKAQMDAQSEAGLPCPYRKRNSRRFNVRSNQNCAVQPHRDFPSLKRHILTLHIRKDYPYKCTRCFTGFDSQADLLAHMRLLPEQMCAVLPGPTSTAAPDPEDGISTQVASMLRDRRFSTRINTWEPLWQLLFPTDDIVPQPLFEPPVVLEFDEIADAMESGMESLQDEVEGAICGQLQSIDLGAGPPDRAIEMSRLVKSIVETGLRKCLNDCKETIAGSDLRFGFTRRTREATGSSGSGEGLKRRKPKQKTDPEDEKPSKLLRLVPHIRAMDSPMQGPR